MPKQDNMAQLSQEIAAELERDSRVLAKELFSGGEPDIEHKSKPEYLDYVRRNWPDPGYRAKLLQQVGPKNFMATAKDAWPDGWTPPPLPALPMQPSVPMDRPAPPAEPRLSSGPTSVPPVMGA